MNCAICRGACCESLTVGLDLTDLPPDARRWVRLHAVGAKDAQVTFAARCTELSAEGRCQIYAERPQLCVAFEIGGHDCLATVRRLRTPAQYQQIRDADDPPSLV